MVSSCSGNKTSSRICQARVSERISDSLIQVLKVFVFIADVLEEEQHGRIVLVLASVPGAVPVRRRPTRSLLPSAIKIAFAGDLNGRAEEHREIFGGEEFGFGAVRKDSSVLEQHNAINFRDDLFEMVSDKEQTNAAVGELPHLMAHFALGEEVEAGGRFVQDESFRMMN